MRLFVAVFPTQECADKLARAVSNLKVFAPDVRWVEPKTAHFTMAFIGELPTADQAGEALKHACASVPPFHVRMGESGAFDSWRHPKILWFGLREGGEAMTRLAEAVRRELTAEKISFDTKPFVPHLTLGRTKGRSPLDIQRRVEGELREAKFSEMRVDRAELIESKTGSAGPVYTSLRREALCGK